MSRVCAWLITTLGLVGCGDPCAERGPHLGATACISGVITDWSAELGNLAGAGFNSFGHIAVLASAPLSGRGVFELYVDDKAIPDEYLFPPPLPLIPTDHGQSCSSVPVVSPPDLRLGWLEVDLYKGKLDPGHGFAVVRDAVDVTGLHEPTGVQYVYSTADGSVRGPQRCNIGTLDWQLDLRRGWNVLLFDAITVRPADETIRITTGPVPANATWHHNP